MKIENIEISGVGGIRELKLAFHDGLNVICGANGVGKSTVLDIIADAFTTNTSNLKRNARCTKGKYIIFFEDANGGNSHKFFEIEEFLPTKHDSGRVSSNESQYVLYFSINRTLNYKALDSIPKDGSRENREAAQQLHFGVENSDLKGWFINRYVFSDKPDSLSVEQKENFKLAKRALSLLDDTVSFLTVDGTTLDIKLQTGRGDVYFEYLSAGYKTCFSLVLGIIKEIEFRFKNPTIKAEDFNGVILIDEIDLHLHPTWQGPLISTLKALFPKVQFIVTTHSPSVLQTLNEKEIIALSTDENGDTIQKTFKLGRYGLQGWTVEEILKDIMGMKTTTSSLYTDTIKGFDAAMTREDFKAIRESYAVLSEMLHPDSILLKMMDIQIAGLEELQ